MLLCGETPVPLEPLVEGKSSVVLISPPTSAVTAVPLMLTAPLPLKLTPPWPLSVPALPLLVLWLSSGAEALRSNGPYAPSRAPSCVPTSLAAPSTCGLGKLKPGPLLSLEPSPSPLLLPLATLGPTAPLLLAPRFSPKLLLARDDCDAEAVKDEASDGDGTISECALTLLLLPLTLFLALALFAVEGRMGARKKALGRIVAAAIVFPWP